MKSTIKISIPKPCHEDWSKMTPNEQGAFCDKCCKTVIDFSNKSTEEIANILLSKSKEKVCGRFMDEQLEHSSEKVVNIQIPFFVLPKNRPFQKVFGVALFVVFGTGLFSCKTKVGRTVGEIAIDDSLQVNTTKVTESNDNDEMIMGQAKVKSGEEEKNNIEETKIEQPVNICEPKEIYEERIKGDVLVEYLDTVKRDTLRKQKIMGKLRVK